MTQSISPLNISIIGCLCVGVFFLGRCSKTSNAPVDLGSRSSSSVEEATAIVGSISSEFQELIPTSVQDVLQYSEELDRFFWFDQYLKGMTSESAPQLLKELEGLRPSRRKTEMLSQFFEKWGIVSGSDAFESAMSYGGQDALLFQGRAAEGWALTKPVEAWSALMELSNSGSIYVSRMGPTMGRIAQLDMGLAVELVSSIRDAGKQRTFFKSILAAASDMNQMPRLLSHLGNFDNVSQQAAMTELLFKEWGKIDNELSMEAINTLTDQSMVESAMRGMTLGWAVQDGKSALEYAIRNSNDPLFKELSINIANEWIKYATSSDVEEVFSTISLSENKDDILNEVFYSLARANPYAALDWVENIPDDEKRAQKTAVLISNISDVDFEAAKTMFRNLPTDKLRLEISYSMINNSIRNGDSADETLSLLNAYGNDSMRGRALMNMAYVASQQDNFTESADLRAALVEQVQDSDILNAEMRERLLKRLNPE